MRLLTFTITLLTCLIIVSVGNAGEAILDDKGGITWQAGVDGIEIEWNQDGSMKRLYSRHSVPVEFPDRRGITKAQIIAEEKAKANIIRFINQSATSTRIVAEVQADINKATQNRQTGEKAVIKKVDDRTVIESLTEITTSFASGNLRGVIVLERGYDSKLEEAWIVVGISEKTTAASRGVKDMIDNPGKTRPLSSSLGIQSSEVRKSKNQDW